jgi:hypothetical protein
MVAVSLELPVIAVKKSPNEDFPVPYGPTIAQERGASFSEIVWVKRLNVSIPRSVGMYPFAASFEAKSRSMFTDRVYFLFIFIFIIFYSE